MKLSQLERAILDRFFDSEGFILNNINLSKSQATDQDITGAGFMTWLKPNQLSLANGPRIFTSGRLGAKINCQIGAGFVIYINDGCVNTLECYTYGEEWPEEVKNF